MLHIKSLHVSVEKQKILNNVTLSVHPGTTHAIMGPNGSGKSTLAYTLAGHPNYVVENGSIIFNGVDITNLSPDKRAQLGIFLAFQHPYVIPGVRVLTFLHESYMAVTGKKVSVVDFQKMLATYMQELLIDSSFMYRNVNEGFSGGEKKRFELLQLMVLKPKLVILDEIDSGLDIDALKIVANGLKKIRAENVTLSIIIITHYQRILQYIDPDFVHVLCGGMIMQSGDAQLVDQLEQKGYDAYQKKAQNMEIS